MVYRSNPALLAFGRRLVVRYASVADLTRDPSHRSRQGPGRYLEGRGSSPRLWVPPEEDSVSDADKLSAREAALLLTVEFFAPAHSPFTPQTGRSGTVLLAPAGFVIRPHGKPEDGFPLGPKAVRAIHEREVWRSLAIETPIIPETLSFKPPGVTQPYSVQHANRTLRRLPSFLAQTIMHLLQDTVEAVADSASAVLLSQGGEYKLSTPQSSADMQTFPLVHRRSRQGFEPVLVPARLSSSPSPMRTGRLCSLSSVDQG